MRWRYQETVLTLSSLAFFVTMVGRLAISPVIPDIAADLDISTTAIGAALTGMWITYALVQFPSGVLADRYGERIVILVAVAGTGLTAVVIAAAPAFGLFVVGTLLLGAAAGLHYSVATALITRTYDDIGTAIGLLNAGGPMAGLITPVVVAWVAVTYDWRLAIGLTAVIAVPVAALFWYGVRPTEPQRPNQSLRDRLDPDEIGALLSRRTIVFTGVVAVLFDFTWQALSSFLPTFFVQHHGYSQTLAGTLFAVYFAGHGVLQIGVGALADRYGRDAAAVACAVTGIAGLAVLVVGSRLWVLVGALLLLGFGMGWAAAVFPRFMDNLAASEQNFGFGLIRTSYMVVAATGSVVVGALADRLDWTAAFGALIALLAVAGGMLVVNRSLDLGY
ncbi:MFS transporter [Halomicrobium urmianum]|uniref:MFS transporter n=1 Tax=Halomicrobium urmianum TaxID=1586233 RepID=UPI001CDA0666|nr:MFS transporter [Halomicrobium urmianum]